MCAILSLCRFGERSVSDPEAFYTHNQPQTAPQVIDAFKASVMWSSWITAGHNEQKLVNFINRLKIKHLEEGGGSGSTGGGVSSFEPDVIKQLTYVFGLGRWGFGP